MSGEVTKVRVRAQAVLINGSHYYPVFLDGLATNPIMFVRPDYVDSLPKVVTTKPLGIELHPFEEE